MTSDLLLRQGSGAVYRNAYDERGLCKLIDAEDGMLLVKYLHDTARNTEYVRAGDLEWVSPDDLEKVES